MTAIEQQGVFSNAQAREPDSSVRSASDLPCRLNPTIEVVKHSKHDENLRVTGEWSAKSNSHFHVQTLGFPSLRETSNVLHEERAALKNFSDHCNLQTRTARKNKQQDLLSREQLRRTQQGNYFSQHHLLHASARHREREFPLNNDDMNVIQFTHFTDAVSSPVKSDTKHNSEMVVGETAIVQQAYRPKAKKQERKDNKIKLNQTLREHHSRAKSDINLDINVVIDNQDGSSSMEETYQGERVKKVSVRSVFSSNDKKEEHSRRLSLLSRYNTQEGAKNATKKRNMPTQTPPQQSEQSFQILKTINENSQLISDYNTMYIKTTSDFKHTKKKSQDFQYPFSKDREEASQRKNFVENQSLLQPLVEMSFQAPTKVSDCSHFLSGSPQRLNQRQPVKYAVSNFESRRRSQMQQFLNRVRVRQMTLACKKERFEQDDQYRVNANALKRKEILENKHGSVGRSSQGIIPSLPLINEGDWHKKIPLLQKSKIFVNRAGRETKNLTSFFKKEDKTNLLQKPEQRQHSVQTSAPICSPSDEKQKGTTRQLKLVMTRQLESSESIDYTRMARDTANLAEVNNTFRDAVDQLTCMRQLENEPNVSKRCQRGFVSSESSVYQNTEHSERRSLKQIKTVFVNRSPEKSFFEQKDEVVLHQKSFSLERKTSTWQDIEVRTQLIRATELRGRGEVTIQVEQENKLKNLRIKEQRALLQKLKNQTASQKVDLKVPFLVPKRAHILDTDLTQIKQAQK